MRYLVFSLAALALVLTGCRGMESEETPVHPNQDMDYQERFNAQDANPFFADNAAMRKPVSGTVARGFLREDSALYTGRDDDGVLVESNPVDISQAVVQRGKERYEVYCSVCHGIAGDGEGIIMTGDYGYTPAPTFHADRLRNEEPDGHFYDVITNGIRSMPGYASQIAVQDRWAIVAYIRALQRSQNASEDDLPESARVEIEQGESANITVE
ncbi:MAG: cytochrome c [Longimonas sp.]|uniref:c-type cytochrome n=1 Tax=Longimonas sp. TaxID=2039626 RepID=UPI003976D255